MRGKVRSETQTHDTARVDDRLGGARPRGAGRNEEPPLSKQAGQCAVWAWLWSDGIITIHFNAPVGDERMGDKRVIGTTLCSGVTVREGVFGDPYTGKHEMGRSTEKLLTLIEEVRDAISTLDGENQAHVMLQEALDAAEADLE